MIIKGQSFTFMYETRNASTGALTPTLSSGGHTIVVYYSTTTNGTRTWYSYTLCSSHSPTASTSNLSKVHFIGSDTGVYFCTIPATDTDENNNTIYPTNCDHIVVSISVTMSGDTSIVVPLQQFYPVDMSQFATPQSVWNYGNTGTPVSTRTLTSDLSANGIADAVWGGSRSIRKLTSETIDDNSSPSKTLALASDVPNTTAIEQAVWNNTSGNRQLTSSTLANTNGSNSSTSLSTGSFPTVSTIASNVWSEATRQLTSNQLDNSSGASLALSGESNVSVDDGNGQSESITTSEIASAVLAGIPDAVWSMKVNGDAYSRMARIADYVWGRNPGDDDRALTTNVLDAYSSPTLALSTEVDTGTDFDPSTIQFPDKDQIATAVWNYGKASGVANKNFRSLSNTAIVSSDGTTSKYIGTLSSSTNTIDVAVWASTDKTLSSADIDDGTTIATTTDIPSIENLTDLLTKIFGVLCHWELDGDDIIVKNDSGDTILTIPTVKDKFGDIIQMDGTSEALP